MKVENLTITRAAGYEANANQLVAAVQIIGEHGKMEVSLSNATVAGIFTLIKEDVQRVASYNATQAGHAVEQAANEMPALENLA